MTSKPNMVFWTRVGAALLVATVIGGVSFLLSKITGHETRITTVEVRQERMQADIGEIKADVKDGFREVQQTIKELRP